MSYIFSARFKNKHKEEDFIWLEMLTLNQKNVRKHIPQKATQIEIFQFDFLPADAVIDIKETA